MSIPTSFERSTHGTLQRQGRSARTHSFAPRHGAVALLRRPSLLLRGHHLRLSRIAKGEPRSSAVMDQSSSHVPAASRTKHPVTKSKNAFGVLARMCRPTILRRAGASVVRSPHASQPPHRKCKDSRVVGGLLAPQSARPQWTRRSNKAAPTSLGGKGTQSLWVGRGRCSAAGKPGRCLPASSMAERDNRLLSNLLRTKHTRSTHARVRME